MSYDVFLDMRGESCPIPLIRTRQALMVLDSGATVCVLATDPASLRDFDEFTEASGHKLLESRAEGGIYKFVVEKA